MTVWTADPRLRHITDVTHDSRDVRDGMLFAAIVGEQVDGHDYAADAVAAGARALLVERQLDLDVTQIVVPDVRAAVGPVAAAVHGHPSEKLNLIGVTGTNGKTTVTHILASLLTVLGHQTAQIGTLWGTRTTPEGSDLQRQLARFVAAGIDTVVMEVSSHALALHRVAGSQFDVAIFTNLGRDHLDLHGTIEQYFRAKARLFRSDLSAIAVVNTDDTYGRLLSDAADITTIGYAAADLDDAVVAIDQLRFTWRGERVTVPLGGSFNIANSHAALVTAVVLGATSADAASAIAQISPVPGRFEVVTQPTAPFAVVVDYAHTPDGIGELLDSARQLAEANQVIIVFGCGGDRDREKRSLMAQVATAQADVVIITSDNPRHEDPDAIIKAALAGATGPATTTVEVDRRAAIAAAIGHAQPGDVVVIAGKGHETTQTIGDTAHPFDDRAVARNILEELK